MKQKGYLIDLCVGTEYERMSVIDPVTRRIVFEGTIPEGIAFLEQDIDNFKNSFENESN